MKEKIKAKLLNLKKAAQENQDEIIIFGTLGAGIVVLSAIAGGKVAEFEFNRLKKLLDRGNVVVPLKGNSFIALPIMHNPEHVDF